MENLQIVIEGVSEEQIQKDIERMTRGWRLFFIEPTGAKFSFLNPFWGREWDGTPANLKEIILEGDYVEGHHKHCIVKFMYDGEERFAFCTWTKELYDFNTGIKHQLEGNRLALKITDKIIEICGDEIY